MDVTGVPVEIVEDIFNKSIVSGAINPVTGHLELSNRAGQVFDAGLVKPPGADVAYPVGSLYFSVNATDPGTLFGGTWVRWGKGRMIVSQDSANARFDTAEEIGGEEKVALTSANNGPHQHTGTTGGQNANHTHTGSTSIDPGHIHATQFDLAQRAASTGNTWYVAGVGAGGLYVTTQNGNHSHTFTTGVEAQAHGHAFTTDSSGSGTAHENMPPFIVAYVWKRTA